MTQPRLYCLCGKTIQDENGEDVGAWGCTKCGSVRCSKCIQEHMRKCCPTLYLKLKNKIQLGELTEELKKARPHA